MRRVQVDPEVVAELYVREGLRGRAIAQRLGCNVGLVYARLEEAGVVRSRWAKLDRDDVTARYVAGESARAIGLDLGVSGPTVVRHLRSWGVPLRSHAQALQPVGRVPCPRSLPLRAYMLGFAWGDLAVDPPAGAGSTIAVRGSTTHEVQVDLVQSLFAPFGRVGQWDQGGTTYLRASLDPSFSFLLSKYEGDVPSWVCGPAAEAAFAAGYIDAEGSFGVYDGRARFKLDSCDLGVHEWLLRWLATVGVPAVGRRIERAGTCESGIRLNADLHRINVNDALGLRRLIATIEPFSRHARRRATMGDASQNVIDRMRARAAV